MKIAPLLFGLVLLPACHGPKMPRALPIRPPQALSIPLQEQPQDPALLGYVKVRDPRATLAQLGEQEVRRLFKVPTVDLNALRPGAPVTALLWGPQGFDFDKIPLAAFLPLQSPLSEVQKEESEGGVRRLKDYTLASLTPAARTHLDAATALLPLAQKKGQWDLQLYISLEAIIRAYGSQIHMGLGALQGIMAAQPKKPGQPDPQAISLVMNKFLARVEEVSSYSMGLSLLPQEIELDTVVQDRQGKPGGPVAAPDLAQFLPAEQLRMQWNARDLAGKMATYLDLYTPLLESTSPGLMGPLRSIMMDWAKLGDTQMGMALSFDAEGGFRGESIVLVRDPEAYLALMRRGVEVVNQPGVKESYRKLGFDLSLSMEQNVRQVQGWQVDRYRLAMTPRADMTAEQQALMKKMPVLQKMTRVNYEVMRMGHYVLVAFNAPLEALAESLLRGHGDHPLRATHDFAAGGTFYGDIDMAGFLRSFRGMLPKEAAVKVPDTSGVPSTVSVAVYDGGPASYYRMRVPRPFLGALFNAVK